MFDFIQNQILGMKWLNELIDKILTSVGISVAGRLGASLQYEYIWI